MKIRICPSFLLYLFFVGICSSWVTCFSAVSALLIHELGHYLAIKAMGDRVSAIELTPFGGVMYAQHKKVSFKGIRGIVIALSGPLANYLAILFIVSMPFFRALDSQSIHRLIMAHAMMMCVNLIPALPLDGGQAVFCAGYYFFRVSTLISLLTHMGFLIGILMLLCAVYGFTRFKVFNVSLALIGLYLIKHAENRRKNLQTENLNVILREQMTSHSENHAKPVSLFEVPSTLPLYALLPLMTSRTASVFLTQDEADRLCFVSANKVCCAMLDNPNLILKQILHTDIE